MQHYFLLPFKNWNWLISTKVVEEMAASLTHVLKRRLIHSFYSFSASCSFLSMKMYGSIILGIVSCRIFLHRYIVELFLGEFIFKYYVKITVHPFRYEWKDFWSVSKRLTLNLGLCFHLCKCFNSLKVLFKYFNVHKQNCSYAYQNVWCEQNRLYNKITKIVQGRNNNCS